MGPLETKQTFLPAHNWGSQLEQWSTTELFTGRMNTQVGLRASFLMILSLCCTFERVGSDFLHTIVGRDNHLADQYRERFLVDNLGQRYEAENPT